MTSPYGHKDSAKYAQCPQFFRTYSTKDSCVCVCVCVCVLFCGARDKTQDLAHAWKLVFVAESSSLFSPKRPGFLVICFE
jgi:hypothetical protein